MHCMSMYGYVYAADTVNWGFNKGKIYIHLSMTV